MNISNRLLKIFTNLFNLNDSVKKSEININKISGWDSLNHLNLIIAIENEFNINILPDDFPKLYNDLGTIVIYIEGKT